MNRIKNDPPTTVFVVGMVESGLGFLGQQLELLGLSPMPGSRARAGRVAGSGELARFNDQLLMDLGASGIKPPLLPRLEFWGRLEHRLDEGQRLFASTRSTASGPSSPWVWSDPRNTILAPFWVRALGLDASVVLVHRNPASVASVVSAKEDLTFEEGLVLWDEYNRLALSLWEELSGIIVGVEAYEDDAKSGIRGLREYLHRLGHDASDQDALEALSASEAAGALSRDSPAIDLPNKIVVLDRVLTRAHLTPSVDPAEIVTELANYYDEDYYTHYGNEGDAPYQRGEPQWTSYFSDLAGHIATELQPTTVLDAGCAIGFLVEALRDRGVEAWGIDISEWAISQVADSVKPFCSVASLTEEISGHFDLVTLIEVIEHLPESVAGEVVANIGRHTDAVLFSSTADGFEEATHINVRTPDYWAGLFASNGFYRDFDHDANYLSKDAVLFRRVEVDEGALIAGYEQALWSTREHLQKILDEVVPERDDLVSAIGGYAERSGLLEMKSEALEAQNVQLDWSLSEITKRRAAESVATQAELLRRDRDTDDLHVQLKRARSEAESALGLVSRIEATKVFRYTARLRRLYGRLRGRRVEVVPAARAHPVPAEPEPLLSFTEWTARYDTLDDADRKAIRLRMNAIVDPPLISVILPVFNTPEAFLREAVESVRNQLYPHWELCIVDDASTEAHVLEIVDDFARMDRRIKVVRRPANGHISAASNSALEVASGQWLALLDHDDRIREHALALMAIEADDHPRAGLIYSDENVIDAAGQRLGHYFKPDFDRLLLLGMNHLCHLVMIRSELVGGVQGFREGFEGSQDWDLLLRVTERLTDEQVRHVPHILYDWRSHSASTAQALATKPYAADAGHRAVSESLERRAMQATVIPIPALGWNRISWTLPDSLPLVTIIIPTRDGVWLERCLRSLWTFTTYGNYEVLVIDNGSTSQKTLEFLRQNDGRLQVFRDERPFSYSGLNNAAVLQANGSILCLLNDDTEVRAPDWLDEMVGQVLQDGVGAVGAKLLYDDGTVQHAGVVLGVGGVGGHAHRGLDRSEIGYWGRAACAQHFSAVTGACMVVRREAWEEVGGLEDENLSIAYNDVDLCLRLAEAGWRIVWTPFAELTHHESVSRGPDHEGANAVRLSHEGRYMHERWGVLLRNDPAYNPNLSLTREDFSLACPPRVGYVEKGSIH